VNNLTDLRLDQLPPGQAQVLLGGVVLLGLVYCFFGYPLLRFLLALTGFLIAGAVAAALAGWLSHGNVLAMAGGLLLGGLCGAMALAFLYRAGVFLLGFVCAMLLAFSMFFSHDASYGPVFTIFAGLFGGTLALFVERPVMKLATAGIGGWLAAVAGMLLVVGRGAGDPALKEQLTPNATLILLGVWFFLTLFGAAFQFSMGRGKKGGK
jgi:hypothetical protein